MATKPMENVKNLADLCDVLFKSRKKVVKFILSVEVRNNFFFYSLIFSEYAYLHP